MNRFLSPRTLFATAAALGSVALASAAHARTDVVFSIGLPVPVVHSQPAPVYVHPAPAYGRPAPVYAPVQHGNADHRVRAPRGGLWGDADRDGVPNARDRDSRFYEGRYAGRDDRRGWSDADRDGVPDRHDRRPNNPYRY